MDVIEYFRGTAAVAGERVRAIADEAWGRPSPCAGWDVRDVVAHLVEELAWVPPLLDGATVAEVGDRFAGDLVGDDPLGAWDVRVAGALAAAGRPGVAERTVHLSFGDFPGAEYLHQLGTDLLVHAWDIARGAGGDESLPDELVVAASAWFAGREELYRSAGVIGPRVEVPAEAGAQSRLLAAFGRSPG